MFIQEVKASRICNVGLIVKDILKIYYKKALLINLRNRD